MFCLEKKIPYILVNQLCIKDSVKKKNPSSCYQIHDKTESFLIPPCQGSRMVG